MNGVAAPAAQPRGGSARVAHRYKTPYNPRLPQVEASSNGVNLGAFQEPGSFTPSSISGSAQ
jgi:hypothetical protein